MADPTNTATATATIEMDLEADAPDGAITTPHGDHHPLHGWMELASAIEAWQAQEALRLDGRAAPRGPSHEAV